MYTNACRDIAGMVVTLDDTGYVAVNYLGTDPSTNVVAVQSEIKEFNYDDMDEELKRLQNIIREATSGKNLLFLSCDSKQD